MEPMTQTLTIIISILVPMLAGFGWIVHQISDLKSRVMALEMTISFVERILEMIGSPFRIERKSKTDPQE